MKPLYRALLGAGFDTLPPRIREMHAAAGHTTARGRCEVVWGESWIGRLAMRLLRMPRPRRDLPLEVHFTASPTVERWERRFPDATFRTVLRLGEGRYRGCFRERMGAVVGIVRLHANATSLVYEIVEMRILGLRVPLRSTVRETVEDDRFVFSVDLGLAGIGRVIRYSGWLSPPVR